jgi:transposase-like protein
VNSIRRATRKQYLAEEKVQVVLDGLGGESSIAELCRREGSAEGLDYSWSKAFLEAGKSRLAGDPARAATSIEVTGRCQRRRAGRTRWPTGPDKSRPTSQSASFFRPVVPSVLRSCSNVVSSDRLLLSLLAVAAPADDGAVLGSSIAVCAQSRMWSRGGDRSPAIASPQYGHGHGSGRCSMRSREPLHISLGSDGDDIGKCRCDRNSDD